MLVTIGHRAAATDLVPALLECHTRIRFFSGLAVTVGEPRDLAPEQIDDGCARVARYFDEALPLHVLDEEESILPRLTGRSRALDDTLTEMSQQHQEHRAPLRRLIDLCAKMRAAPTDVVRAELREVAHHLDREFRRHLEIEETRLFPAIPAQLSSDERAAILAEMRGRRQRLNQP
jgi:iron-sulfur cluster repair protein YtfE (RIC family)